MPAGAATSLIRVVGRGHAEVRDYVYDEGGGGRRGIFREHGEFAVWNVCDEGLVWALEIVGCGYVTDIHPVAGPCFSFWFALLGQAWACHTG